MAGRHRRSGKHSEKTVKAKEFYKITPVKPVKNERLKGEKLTPSDDRD